MAKNDKKGKKADFQALVDLMARLRSPGGCPWDREQTPDSLKPYILEEAYEVITAIEQEDWDELPSELGDLLLQVLFQARLAEEAGRFDITDVIDAVVAKMTRRHPHVFGGISVSDAAGVMTNWEKIKRRETPERSVTAGVDRRLPALLRSHRIQEKVGRVGFDWENPEGALEKVREELEEFTEAWATEPAERAEEEMGDLLFALVNAARLAGINAEEALRKSIVKFEERFRSVEDGLRRQGLTPEEASLDQMEALWQAAKKTETS
jgi:tetrapyrrole methylase family protein/MazG family protein